MKTVTPGMKVRWNGEPVKVTSIHKVWHREGVHDPGHWGYFAHIEDDTKPDNGRRNVPFEELEAL